MTRTIPILCLFVYSHAWAQCGYPVTLRTNKDFCIGSSLVVTSSRSLERIVWYKDGKPVDSALADQHLDSTATVIKLNGAPNGDITTDDKGNVYTFFDGNIAKWTPGLGDPVPVAAWSNGNHVVDRLFVDHQGNIYVVDDDHNTVIKFHPGDTSGTEVASQVAGVADVDVDFGIYVDCGGAVYFGNSSSFAVTRWHPGAASGQVVAGGNGNGNALNQLTFISQIFVDSAGDVYVLEEGQLRKWSPGAAAGTIANNWASAELTDMWMSGQDTVYLMNWNSGNGPDILIQKSAVGTSNLQTIGSFPVQIGSAPPALTMDIDGNIYAIDGVDDCFYEFRRTSSIDSAFTPTETGEYYAVVTNMQGYAAMTNKIVINTPQSGLPSIAISATATSTPVCTPITFTANVANAGVDPNYQWIVSGVPAGGDSTTYSYNLFANGDQVYCILNAQAGCNGPVTDTSNTITLNIDPHGAASVTIAASKDSICQGDTIEFKATVINGSNAPVFEWLLNGDSTGDVSAGYGGNRFSNGDVVTCLITSDDACGLAKSNSIPLVVSVPPTVESGQIFTILHGHSQTLEPVTTGDIDSWLWTPSAGLNDPLIADPVASPDTNTLYTLIVSAPGGCSASGTILVNVYTPLSLPNAFSPNGDGHNDLFYVLGGPVNSVVEDFAVYNRYGGEIFHAHDVAPGDRRGGWDGSIGSRPAPPGTYVYMAVMKFANGNRQVYKGTVILVR